MSGPEGDLARALEQERLLREEVGDLIRRRQRAEAEAAQLEARAELEGADGRVGAAASTLRARAEALAAEIDDRRRALRAQEGLVAELRAREPA